MSTTAKAIPCCICQKLVYTLAMSVPHPEAPDLFKPSDPDAWFGIVPDAEGSPVLIVVCGPECVNRLATPEAPPAPTEPH
jgi:hypothetical protein